MSPSDLELTSAFHFGCNNKLKPRLPHSIGMRCKSETEDLENSVLPVFRRWRRLRSFLFRQICKLHRRKSSHSRFVSPILDPIECFREAPIYSPAILAQAIAFEVPAINSKSIRSFFIGTPILVTEGNHPNSIYRSSQNLGNL